MPMRLESNLRAVELPPLFRNDLFMERLYSCAMHQSTDSFWQRLRDSRRDVGGQDGDELSSLSLIELQGLQSSL